MRYREVSETSRPYDPLPAYRAKDRETLKKAAGFYSEGEFIDLIAGRKQAPRTHYVGFDAEGQAVASFGDPERGARYDRVERHDPSRQALSAYQKYQRLRDSLAQLYADLQRERGDDFMAQHTFSLDEIEIKRRESGMYDAFVRGRLVGRASVNLSPEPRMPQDTRTIHKVAVEPNDRRQGVARKLYQTIEHDLVQRGLRLLPSHARSDDAKAFWQRYRPSSSSSG